MELSKTKFLSTQNSTFGILLCQNHTLWVHQKSFGFLSAQKPLASEANASDGAQELVPDISDISPQWF
ncbi:hypothetical protein HYX10_04520 [Candidatus Woesearchaeota archaeon]|nr:hypothetical protein [Candidatus Woesearchaeota archaeon]